MLNRSSHALIAALAVIAAPAFAQQAATPAPAETTQSTPADSSATDAPAIAPGTDSGTTESETTGAAEDDTTSQGESALPAATADPAEPSAGATGAPVDGTTATAPGTQEAAPATAAPAPADNGEPKAGSYYVKSTHQDWTVRCVKADQGRDPCELYQLMKDGNDNSVAEMTLIPLQNGDVAAGATLVAPLETDLIEGLGFAVDSNKARGYPFSFCAPVGCVARMGFTAAELSELKRGGKGTLTLLPFGGDPKKPVQLNLSLAGFTAAFDELTQYATAPAPAAEDAAATPEEPTGN